MTVYMACTETINKEELHRSQCRLQLKCSLQWLSETDGWTDRNSNLYSARRWDNVHYIVYKYLHKLYLWWKKHWKAFCLAMFDFKLNIGTATTTIHWQTHSVHVNTHIHTHVLVHVFTYQKETNTQFFVM